MTLLPVLAEVAEDAELGHVTAERSDHKSLSGDYFSQPVTATSVLVDASTMANTRDKARPPAAERVEQLTTRPATAAARSSPLLIASTLELLNQARSGRRAGGAASVHDGGKATTPDAVRAQVVDALNGATAALPADVLLALNALLGAVEGGDKADGGVVSAATGVTSALQALVDHGGVPLIVQALTKGVANEALVVTSCRLLKAVTRASVDLAALVGVTYGGVEAVLEGMGRHRRSLPVQTEALHTLLGLVRVEAARGHFMAHPDGVWLPLDAMRTHEADAHVQAYGCHLLASLAFGSAAAREAMGAAGAPGAIVAALSSRPSEVSLQVLACTALRNLAWMNATNHRRLASAHGVEAVLASIADHPGVERIAEQATGALGNISFHDPRLQERIFLDGGVATCIKMLVAHGEQSGCLSENSVTILSNLSEMDVGLARPVGTELMATDGALDTIVRTLKQHGDHPSLVIKSCYLLRSLCYVPENRRKLGEVDSVRTLLGVLKSHPVGATQPAAVVSTGVDADLLEGLPLVEKQANVAPTTPAVHADVFWALTSLVAGDEPNKEAFGVLGGLPQVLSSMAALPADEAVQRHGCSVLDMAANGNAHNVQRALVAGALGVVYAAMQAHPSVLSIQENGCSFMIKMAAESGSTSSDLSARGAEAFLDRVRKAHADSPTVVSLTNQLVSLIAADAAEGAARGGRPVAGRGGGASARLRSRSRAAGSDRSRGLNCRNGSRSPSPRRGRGGGSDGGRTGGRGGGRDGGREEGGRRATTGGGRSSRFGGLSAVEEAETPAAAAAGAPVGGAVGGVHEEEPPRRAARNRRGLDLLCVPE